MIAATAGSNERIAIRTRLLAVSCPFLLVVLSSSCCHDSTYKPTCDPTPLLNIGLTSPIESLEDIPRTETHVIDGINRSTGRRQPDDIREMFYSDTNGVSVHYFLFFTVSGARDEIERVKNPIVQRPPIFATHETNGNTGLVAFTTIHCSRSDSTIPLCSCDDKFTSSAVFRIGNLVVYIEVRHVEQQTTELSEIIRHVAGLLERSIHVSNIRRL